MDVLGAGGLILSDVAGVTLVDDTEGGNTSRTNVNFAILKPISETAFVKANAFYSYYDFELYSNFTFFLRSISFIFRSFAGPSKI